MFKCCGESDDNERRTLKAPRMKLVPFAWLCRVVSGTWGCARSLNGSRPLSGSSAQSCERTRVGGDAGAAGVQRVGGSELDFRGQRAVESGGALTKFC